MYAVIFVSGSSFKFLLKVGVEESIVHVPRIAHQSASKNTNNARSEVRASVKQLIRDLSVIRGAFTIDSSTPTLR
jgi:hypothetical protein